MKHYKDFIFCDGVLTSQSVFYLVAVGTSSKDRQALAYVSHLARSPDYFFCDHSQETMTFLTKCAESIFHRPDDPLAINYLRRMVVTITWLASFLRKNPPTLLNSLRISVPENRLKINPSKKGRSYKTI